MSIIWQTNATRHPIIVLRWAISRYIPSLGAQSQNSEMGKDAGRPIPVLTIIPRLDVTEKTRS